MLTNPKTPYCASIPMQLALQLAVIASECGEVPIGAIIWCPRTQKVIAEGHNRILLDTDPTAHAEVIAIRKACQILKTERLIGYDLYTTLEPCTMCAGVIAHARLERLYYGAFDIKGGAVDNGVCFFSSPSCHHHPEIYGGLCEAPSKQLLHDFFRKKRLSP